jgi:peptidoglycan/xylan/chitin deacetylase (PgdA/CDA1 family)
MCRMNIFSKTLYLSFDDGPNIKVTTKVLDLLEKYNAKASFFCKGSNAILYPEIFQKIVDDGHTIGNHSFLHLNAFKVSNRKWLIDVLRKSPVSDSVFFRPPYGRIFPWQCRRLKREYKIVLWDVLTHDYKQDYSVKKIKNIILNKVRDGSIIVFHDTTMAAPRMFPALEFTLEYFTKLGYKFDRI